MGRGPRLPRELVEPHARLVVELLSPLTPRLALCGSFRRRAPTVSDIDLVMVGPVSKEAIVQRLETSFRVKPEAELHDNQPRKCFFLSNGEISNVQLDVWIVPPKCYGGALLYCTGPGQFNTVMRRYARLHGLRLTVLGIDDGRKMIARETEEDCFRALGWTYLSPTERSNWMAAVEPYLEEMDKIDAQEQGNQRADI
jgi:DNA polymerase/3'-5' exonuclease PolX